jgi:transcriptional regulator NrdR family protein
MNCTQCQSRTDVYDTRVLHDMGVRRKRKCVECGFRFATLESLDAARPLRIRKPKPAKAVKIPRPKVARPSKVVATKPGRRVTNFDDEVVFDGSSEDLWDVARELGIEGYK